MSIREKRIKSNTSQAILAEKLGVTQGAISQWENGTAFPRSEIVPKLAKILNCSIDDLFKNEEE